MSSIFFIALIIISEQLIEPNDMKLLENDSIPSEFYKEEYIEGKYTILLFEDKVQIRYFHNLIKNKLCRKLNTENFNEQMSFSYGYKGETLYIDDKGRILIHKRKSDIKEESRFHWIAWKLNMVYDRDLFVSYITEPDNRVAEIINTVEMKPISN